MPLAARDALPNVVSLIENARSQITRLEVEREKAVVQHLKSRADEIAPQYTRIFKTLCRAHDQLVGISAALTDGAHGGDIRMSGVPMQVPRFNLPSSADPNEYIATMTHIPAEFTVEEATSD